ncbi:hypothetical protein T459_01174 [Capsicum annuum]|uniref:Uncharacterized protein n=1 Tax=Capsicum annuum TaxID=4072 RepID=A0A2G3AGC1_CAPAN|nr:hypothetical protein T459_01174 [Capsicum annuum]
MFIVDYMKKMNTFAQNLAAQPAINVDLILPIQGGLGTEYDTLVVSVTSRSEQTALADLQGLLFSHEYRQQIAPNKQHLPAMVVHPSSVVDPFWYPGYGATNHFTNELRNLNNNNKQTNNNSNISHQITCYQP